MNEFWKSGGNPCDYYKEPTVSNFITGKEITLVGTPAMGDAAKMTQGIEADHNVKINSAPYGRWVLELIEIDYLVVIGRQCLEECLESYKYTRLNEALRSVGYDWIRSSSRFISNGNISCD